MRAGTHIESPDVLYTRGARIEVHASRPLEVNLDGEPIRARDLCYSVHTRSLQLMLPE
jgi:diacylglycerol kinase family enzyme